ncbi:MAG: DUF456 domain-containing protein [Smithellaceae bacterium]
MAAAGFALFIAILFIGIYMALYGLPGAVLIFFNVFAYALITGFERVGWQVLLVLLFLAFAAETLDFLLGLTGVLKPPVMKASLWGAAIGALLGMTILTPLLWGLGIWGGFFAGALAGLSLIEIRRQSRKKLPHQASWKSFLGMIGQKGLKGALSLAMIFIALSNIYS